MTKSIFYDGKLTSADKKRWHTSTINKILRNEKYMGDALLQKTYTVDFLTKKSVTNNGVVPQYYAENSHEDIITKEIFMQVQEELIRRSTGRISISGKKSIVWRCISRLENTGLVCNSRTVFEDLLKDEVIKAINDLLGQKDDFLEFLSNNIDMVINEQDTTAVAETEKKLEELQKQLLIRANSKEVYNDITNEIYRLREEKHNALVEEAEKKAVWI